jgi:tetratricopeptide (TPR) repeat protein
VVEVGVDRYRFAHALVRSALRDELSRSRRVRLHLAAADALEALHADDLQEHAAALAYHCFEAVPAGGAERAYRYSLLAAEHAARLLAFAEVAESYGRALDVLDRAGEGDPLARARLLLAKAEAHREASDFVAALEAAGQAAGEARRVGSAELLAESAVAFENASFEPGFPGDAALALLEEARTALGAGGSRLHALTTAGLARALEYSGRAPEGAAEGARALAMARRLDDTAVTAAVLFRIGFASRRSVAPAESNLALGAELHRVAREAGDDDGLRFGAYFAVCAAEQVGDLKAADRWLKELESVMRRSPQWRWEWHRMGWRVSRALLAGDLPLAEHLLDEMRELDPPRGIDADGVHGVATFLLRREQGRLAGLAPVVKAMVPLRPDAGWWGPGLAALYAELGLLDEARAELDRLAANDFAAVADDGMREQCLGFLAEAAAAVSSGDHAARLLDLLRPTEGKLLYFWGNHTCLGPADRILAMLASTAGRTGEAEEWFQRATAFSRRLPSPLWVAHCLYDHAEHRRRTSGAGAEEMLAEAAELCERHRLVGLGARPMRTGTQPGDAGEAKIVST